MVQSQVYDPGETTLDRTRMISHFVGEIERRPEEAGR
jgi:hypothetical protein